MPWGLGAIAPHRSSSVYLPTTAAAHRGQRQLIGLSKNLQAEALTQHPLRSCHGAIAVASMARAAARREPCPWLRRCLMRLLRSGQRAPCDTARPTFKTRRVALCTCDGSCRRQCKQRQQLWSTSAGRRHSERPPCVTPTLACQRMRLRSRGLLPCRLRDGSFTTMFRCVASSPPGWIYHCFTRVVDSSGHRCLALLVLSPSSFGYHWV